ncbi:MAG: hypothetical protein P8N76_02460 [Pirellulaceae bacterium]|nr:hypothetical protein [Pirellulaceae bacterium]
MGSSRGQPRQVADSGVQESVESVAAADQPRTNWERWSPPRKVWLLCLAGLLFIAWLAALLLLIDFS